MGVGLDRQPPTPLPLPHMPRREGLKLINLDQNPECWTGSFGPFVF